MFRTRPLVVTGLLFAAGLTVVTALAQPAATAPRSAPGKSKFTLFIYESPAELAKRTEQGDAGGRYWGAYAEFASKLEKAGVMSPSGCCLQPDPLGKVVRLAGGKSVTSDGAYASAPSGHQLGGYFVIEVESLDAALDWARQAPAAATAAVEVRPSYPMPPAMNGH